MLIQLAPPPLPKARHSRANAIEKNLETNPDSLELDVVVDIASYSMTLGRLGGPSSTPRSAKKDSVDVGLRLVSSPACTPVPAALPIPLPLRVSVEEGSTFSTLEKRKKEKIQEYYLSSSSSPSTASPSSPSSQFERCGTETDPSSPDTPYPNVARNDDANTNIVGSTQVRKRSSFFGWEFAWDQEALERADDAGKLRSTVGSGGSPVRWKSDLNPSSSEKILIVDQASFTDLDEDVDADEDAGLQKTPTMKSRTTTRSYSHSPQSHHHSTCSSPNQQRHEAATSIHCSSINKSCITTSTTMNSPQKLSPSLTRRGLSLKRSFQMGSTVGRTLGPGLTLSSAELRFGSDSNSGPLPTSNPPDKSIRRCESEGFGFRGEEEKRESEEKGKKAEKFGKEDDEDVDVETEIEIEMRSLGAARPVPASYARATATATILTPATGTDIGVDSGGGCKFASRSGGGNPVKYTAMSKTKLHSRPSLPTMNTTTTVSSPPACSTITEQYQQQQHGRNSVFSTAARKPHPFIDWFRSLETSTSRGDADVEQEMEIIRRSGRGSGNERLSSLPLLPPLPPLLLPSLTPPSQSQSLPPTPTKSQSTLLGKPSTSSFKKRSVPPAMPPLPRSSEWAHSMLTTNGVSGAAISVVSLAHSRTRSVSRTSSQLPSRPTTPKPSTRLSAMNMGSVRNAFAGVGAKVSARMSINSASTRSSAGATASNTVASSVGMGMDDIDGDFMDLRDPFASPPPFKLVSVFRGGDHTGGGGGGGSDFWVSERAMSSLGGGAGVANYDDDDSVEVGITRRISSISGGKRRVNMNAWGRLPIPSTLPLPGTAPETSNGGVSSEIANRKKAHSHHGERRKHKKEKRARKAAVTAAGVLVETNPSLHGYSAPCSAGEEDADFGVEEALLSQRLLRRLDSVSFEWD